MKKRLKLKKVTIRDLDEASLKTVAGGATTPQTQCTCPFTCNGQTCPGQSGCPSTQYCNTAQCSEGNTCGTAGVTCGATCAYSCFGGGCTSGCPTGNAGTCQATGCATC